MLARIRELSRLELAGETLRAALEALAAAAPGWLATVIDASWQEAYGQRIDQIRLPGSQAKRDALAVRYGRDGYRLLEAVRGPGAPGWARDLPAVEVLRRVWVQQYYRGSATAGRRCNGGSVTSTGSRRAEPGSCLLTILMPAAARSGAPGGRVTRPTGARLSATAPMMTR